MAPLRLLSSSATLVPVLLWLATGMSGRQSPVWIEPFQNALTQLQAGDLSAATLRFELLWNSYPRDAQLATSIGGALDSTSHHEEATAWYQRALSIQPDFDAAVKDLALNYAVRGKLADAEALLSRRLEHAPHDSNAAYNLGLISLRLRHYTQALSALQKAEASKDSAALIERIRLAEATAFFHLARYGEAAAVLGRSGGTQEASGIALLGSAQALAGDLPAAIKTLQQGIKAYPANPQLYLRLALVFAEGRRDNDARSVLRAAAERIPGSPAIAYATAVLDLIAGRDEEAIRWAEESVRGSDEQAEVWGLLGTLYERSGQTEKALAAYGKAMASGAGAYTGAKYAELLIRLEKFPEAEHLLMKLSQEHGENAVLDRTRGKLLRAERKFREAENCLRRAVRRDPADPQTHYALAQVLQHEGQSDAAEEQFKLFKSAKEKSESVRVLELFEGAN